MKIGLIDADLLDNGTRHPNLALMKISGYMKKKGYSTELLLDYKNIRNYDEVHMSKVFKFTEVPINIDDYSNLYIGGTGFFEDGGENLENEIEHSFPDYELYDKYIEREINRGIKPQKFTDYIDYSIGFSTRGCFRKCSFCVNKKYDKVLEHSPISEFLDTSRKYIHLWDDNFLGYENWSEILDQIEATNKPFQFRQGLDIRLMNDEKAKRLSSMKHKGDFIFAFDHLKDKDLIERKLKLWKTHCKKTTKLYVLCAYESQDEKDIISVFERIKVLMKYGCLPYIMRYESYENSEMRGMYINLGRWCNQPSFFKKMSLREFAKANQDYAKTDNKCATVRYLEEFEEKYPETAKKYLDLKFEDMLEY